MTHMEFFSAIAVNIFVLLGFVMVCTLVRSWSSQRNRDVTPAQKGLLFGAMAIVAMLVPAVVEGGSVFDCRAGVIGAGAYIGGPIAAAVSLPLPLLFRWMMGGEGMLPGLLELILPACIGSLCHLWYKRTGRAPMSFLLPASLLAGLGSNLLIGFFVARTMPQTAFPVGVGAIVFIFLGTPATMALIGSLVLLEREHTEAVGSLAESERRTLHSQKMAAVGQLARKVAHNFANALMGVIGNAQLAKDECKDQPGVLSLMDDIIKAGSRVSTLAGDVLAFSSSASGKMVRVEPGKCVEGIREIVTESIGPSVEIDFDVTRDIGKVEIDPDRMEQMIVHLAVNSSESMQGQGKLRISVSKADLTEEKRDRLQGGILEAHRHRGDFAVISIKDTGCGIAPENLERIFEPFYTTKENHSNAGLGLATVYNIVQQNNGLIDVESRLKRGTTFFIYLPIVG